MMLSGMNAASFWSKTLGLLLMTGGMHGDVTHIAMAISVCDLQDQVATKCPAGTPVPSVEWPRPQLWPEIPTAKAAFHPTGHFKVRFRVQC